MLETRTSHADDVRSAILNCICPECGGVIELETTELKCLGGCGKRWRDIWVRIQLHLQPRKARDDRHRRDEQLGSKRFRSKLMLEARGDNAPLGHGTKPGERPTLTQFGPSNPRKTSSSGERERPEMVEVRQSTS